MKNLFLIVIGLCLSASLESCKKKIYGCMDESAENYSPVATDDAQNCVYPQIIEDEVLVSNVVTGLTWSNQGTYWSSTVTWNSITSDIIDNGAVSAYIGDGSGGWAQIPYTIFWTGYQTNVNAVYSVGQVDLTWEDSDGTLPDNPYLFELKVVIFK